MSATRTVRMYCLALWIALGTAAGQADPPAADEYRVKAAFLYNFAKFVEWPADAFKDAREQIGMCVLGTDPFGSALVEAVEGKELAGRRFETRNISKAEQSHGCHILFVANSERKKIGAILRSLGQAHILTVGESDEFIANGGVISFHIQDARVRIHINPEAAARARIRISSKLLSLSEIRSGGAK